MPPTARPLDAVAGGRSDDPDAGGLGREPDSPRYVQETGRFGTEGQITLQDDELSYIRLNPRSTRRSGWGGWRWRSRRSTTSWARTAMRRNGEQLGGAIRAVDAGWTRRNTSA